MSPAGHLNVVDECDYYVLVIGARYGSTDAVGRRLIDLRHQRELHSLQNHGLRRSVPRGLLL
jgi:hypothetical protein